MHANIVPIQYNIGTEDDFKGVVDLINNRAIYWNEDDQGLTFDSKDIPEDLIDRCSQLREEMVEAAAEANEELMDAYLESGELTVEQIKEGLRIRSLANELIVGLCGSAFKNKGVQAVLTLLLIFFLLQMKLRLYQELYQIILKKMKLLIQENHQMMSLSQL